MGEYSPRVNLATEKDASKIAKIHCQEINEGFLSQLGEKFLREFYKSIITTEVGFCVVARVNGEVVGFVSGCTNLNKFYSDFFKRHTFRAITILLPKVFSLRRVKQIIETLIYPQKEKHLPPAELLTIAVESEFHGRGIAQDIFKEFVNEMKKCGVKEFKVLVGESLTRAIKFYEKMGFKFHSQTFIHKGSPSRIYIYTL